MTKTITKSTLAILALGAAMPAMAATDGTPGATSTGTFDANLTVETPPATQLHIYGLQDISFHIPYFNGAYNFPARTFSTSGFCVTRSDAGNVKLTVTQTGAATGSKFFVDNLTPGAPVGRIEINLGHDGQGLGSSPLAGVPFEVQPSLSNCVAGSDTFTVAKNVFSFNVSSNQPVAGGSYRGTLTVVASVQ